MGRNKLCGVYKITCITTNTIYIGSSSDIYKRWGHHKYNLRKNIHNNPYLQHAWNKYGEENFIFEVLELCEKREQFKLEQKYLDMLKPFPDGKNGYNILKNSYSAIDRNRIKIEFLDYDEIGCPHKIKKGSHAIEMPITYEDFLKPRRELQDEYYGYVMMEDLYNDMVMCDPDYE